MSHSIIDTQSIIIAKSAQEVFAFMADSDRLDQWSFATWQTELRMDGLLKGKSIFDGAEVYVAIDPLADRGLIDYRIGTAPDDLQARIQARVMSGQVAGFDEQHSVLMLIAIRAVAIPLADWQQLIAAHSLAVQIIKSALETDYDHRDKRSQTLKKSVFDDSRR